MRTCFLCAKEVPLERRNSVFCSLRCEITYQELERRAPQMDNAPPQEKTQDGRPREEWPGLGKGEEKF